jgi:hypothetical protein
VTRPQVEMCKLATPLTTRVEIEVEAALGHVEIEQYFRQYMFIFMFSDIGREIALARSGNGGGNFLAALGLLCYTEALGRLQNHVRNLSTTGSARNFEGFFDELGALDSAQPYKAWRCRWEGARRRRVYDVLRCGMAHEYLPKVATTAEVGAETPMGVYEDAQQLVVNVDSYFRDFKAAASRLFAEFMTTAGADLPPTNFTPPQPC